MDFIQLVYNKRNELDLLKYQNELSHLKEQNNNNSENENKIKLLEIAVASLTKPEAKKDQLIDLTQYVYQKPWIRMTDFHKINRLEEFVKRLTDDEKQQKNCLTKLKTCLTNKKLTSKNVQYDQKEGKIISINGVKVNNNKIEIEC